jgi:hypothetical protein
MKKNARLATRIILLAALAVTINCHVISTSCRHRDLRRRDHDAAI